MTDLRDHIDAFDAAARRILERRRPRLTLVHARPATCHPNRPLNARGLCKSCYQLGWLRGNLPDLRRGRLRAEFVPDYELLRSEGYTRRQIAERLDMTYSAITQAYLRAVRAGDLTPDRRTA
jgi:hypothetical protein